MKGPRCDACGLLIDAAAGTTHPSCSKTPEGAEIRRMHTEWVYGGMPPGGWTLPQRALGIIRTAATLVVELNANSLREAFDRAAIPGPLRGPAWARAVRAHYVEQVGYQPSTGGKTNGHPIARYKSLIYRPERKKAA